ncbi:hypothetical protein LINPERPRIM_LOCUS16374 [Linum perenne]
MEAGLFALFPPTLETALSLGRNYVPLFKV